MASRDMFDTSVRFKINENSGAGIVGAGKAMIDLSDTQLDKKKREDAANYKNAMLNIYENQDKRAEQRLQNDEDATNRLIEKASKSEADRIELEDATIKAFEEKHPIFMGKKNKDGSINKDYEKLSRAEKLALVKLGANEAFNPKTPQVINVSTRADGERVAIYKDGTIKPLGFKAKDYQQSSSDEPGFDLTQSGELSKKAQERANKLRAERLDQFNID